MEPRRYKWKYGPLRLAMPWIAVAAGLFLGIRGLVTGADGNPLLTVVGFGLVALGVIAFFVYRAMAKRGI